MDKLRVGLVGSGFVSTIHAEAMKTVSAVESACWNVASLFS